MGDLPICPLSSAPSFSGHSILPLESDAPLLSSTPFTESSQPSRSCRVEFLEKKTDKMTENNGKMKKLLKLRMPLCFTLP